MTVESLLAQAAPWALAKRRALDVELLHLLLDLRADHDGLAPTYWPAATVEQLLLVRWPAHGPTQPPDPDALLATLDTYWRFLRATGRLAHGSAQPAELVKAARKALPRMAQASADPARFGTTKVLLEFGRSIGIDLDTAASVEELQERFDRIATAWNELPEAERTRRMPQSGDSPAEAGSPAAAGSPERAPAPGLDRGDPRVAADEARTAGFTQACLALAAWVDTGRPVTATGVLRLAPAEQAYAALGLAQWQHTHRQQLLRDRRAYVTVAEQLPADPADDSTDLVDDAGAAKWAWRSAGDCEPLNRLWWSAEAAKFIEIGSTKARATGRPHPDEDWLHIGLGLVLGLCQRWRADRGWAFLALLYLCGMSPQPWVPLQLLRDWWDAHLDQEEPAAMTAQQTEQWARIVHEVKQSRLDRLLADFADTGLWERRGEPDQPGADELRLTDFGRQFATVLGSALEDNWLPA